MNKSIHLIWQIPSLTISLFICFAIGGMLSGLAETSSTTADSEAEVMAEAAQTAALLLLSCFITSLVLSLWLYHLAWQGWKAILTVFIVYFTANTFMTQIESIFFNSALQIPTIVIGQIILSGLLISVLYAPISVFIMGKGRTKHSSSLTFKFSSQLLKTTMYIALVYVFIYFIFGYYVAWQSEAVRAYYSGSTAILPFSSHMLGVIQTEVGLIPFQFFRGLIWAGLAILIDRSVEAPWGLRAVLTGLIFGVMLAGGLLLPNPFIPEAVRWAHLWETSTSNFLFGFLAIYFLHRAVREKSSTLAQTD